MPESASKAPALDLAAYWKNIHSKGFTGAGITVAVVDTGASSATYDQASKLNSQARDFVGSDVAWGQIKKLWKAEIAVPPEHLKHGDQVFRRLLSGAPSSSFLDIQTLFPHTSKENLINSIKTAIEHKADIVNLSLGRMIPNEELQTPPGHAATCPVCQLANTLVHEHDMLPMAAIGNWANQAMACPAVAMKVISIGSVSTKEESAFYREHPEQELQEFLEGRSSTSFATAMATAQFTILRSAFPGVDAAGWLEFIDSNRRVANGAPWSADQDVLFEELRTICGWAANFADWKEFAAVGIQNRRELVTAAFATGLQGYPKIAEWLASQRVQLGIFVRAQQAFSRATDPTRGKPALSEAIADLNEAVSNFLAIDQITRAAVARIFLGSKLVQRAWNSVPGHIIANDAIAAETELTQSIKELLDSPPRDQHIHAGNALAWRARARTLLASVQPSKNDEALQDAKQAVDSIIASKAKRKEHDLAIAHLHLARAHYFAAWLKKQQNLPSGHHPAAVLANAGRALELSPSDGYVSADANWLLKHANGTDS